MTKSKRRRIWRRIGRVLGVSGVLVYVLLWQLSAFRLPDGWMLRWIDSPKGYEKVVERYQVAGRTIRYFAVGRDSLPALLLLHGSPSSLLSWKEMLEDSVLLERFQLVAVDRPGYGYSDFGRVVVSPLEQAELLGPLLKALAERRRVYVLGSSYGGPVAAALAMRYPEAVYALMLQSAALAPGEEKIYPISYPTSRAPLRWLVPPTLRMANEEKLNHAAVLTEMVDEWPLVTAPVTLFHGEADSLVYFSNTKYAQERLVNALDVRCYAVPGKGHGMLWSDYERTRRVLLEGWENACNVRQAAVIIPSE